MSQPRACIVSIVRPARDVRTFHKEARSLACAGWDVTMVGPDAGPAAMVEGIRVLPLPVSRGARRPLLQARALRLALAMRADVYQVADVELLPAALLLRRSGRAVVYDCIEDYPAYMRTKAWLPAPMRPLAAGAVAMIERVVTPRLGAVLTADAGTATRLRGYGAAVAVVHNFPRRDEFATASPDAPRTHDVVYHGSLPPYHLEALAAIARRLGLRLPSTRWAIVGEPDSESARDRFVRAVADAGLVDCVRLHPRIPVGDVPAFLGTARTGVVPLPDVPKFRTNVPMKLFEYLAAGVPTVASDLPPIRTLLGDTGAAVLVRAGDHEAFAAALGDVLGNPVRAAALIRRGREAVMERFNWEREESTLLRCYTGLLFGPGLRAVREEMHA